MWNIIWRIVSFIWNQKLQESQGAYGTTDKKSIKPRVSRWYTVQSNEIRKHIFSNMCIYFCLLLLNDQFTWSAEQKIYLKYLRITNNLHLTTASLIVFCYINYQSIWSLTTYKLSLYITVSNCCIHYVVIRPVIANCENILVLIVWILTSKLYVLFHFPTPSKWIYSKLSKQGSFFAMIKKRGKIPIWTSKLYVMFYSSTPSKQICFKLSQQGSLLWWLKRSITPLY